MQEPQYRSPGVRELLDAVGEIARPCMSIMNMPPLPYIKRIPGLDYKALEPAYTDAPRLGLFGQSKEDHTSTAPIRRRSVPPTSKANELLVTLPTNFKCAKFEGRQGHSRSFAIFKRTSKARASIHRKAKSSCR